MIMSLSNLLLLDAFKNNLHFILDTVTAKYWERNSFVYCPSVFLWESKACKMKVIETKIKHHHLSLHRVFLTQDFE